MKTRIALYSLVLLFAACVPAKKYNDLLLREQTCSEELEKYKSNSQLYEGRAKEFEAKFTNLQKDVAKLKADTTELGNKYRFMQTQYDKMAAQNEILEKSFDKLRINGARETAELQADLEAKNIELQRKEDALNSLETELLQKQQLLAEREKRVNELEEAIRRKDEAQRMLKDKVAAALKGFENKGLSVVQKDGKIYVSLEAKLLFPSGSTAVDPEGKKALVELAKVLQDEKELEIVVEGHTDTDKLNSSSYPHNNWELSVLRATSVVEILLANSKMDPKQLMAAGRSEFHPVDPANKAKNRRIEIIISPNLNELFNIISQDGQD